jgi:DNA-binding beta-propeller fold protein YncE
MGYYNQMSYPKGVAVDWEGNIYVADTYHNRIQVFNKNGVFFRMVGVGQLTMPADVAVDGDGKVYVADTGNDRVQVFSGDELTFERAVGLGREIEKGR